MFIDLRDTAQKKGGWGVLGVLPYEKQTRTAQLPRIGARELVHVHRPRLLRRGASAGKCLSGSTTEGEQF